MLLAADGDTALTSWDQVEVGRAREDCATSAGGLLREFVDERASSVALVGSLRTNDLHRAGQHPQVGRLTVAEIVNEWVHHDRNHFKQMLTNVQEYAWRQMGNAQRFSLPH